MSELEATRAKLKCLEMVEGTRLNWWRVVRHKNTRENLTYELSEYCTSSIEFALGVVEGKPVWEGDKLYWIGENEITNKAHNFNCKDWSWSPPKPATLMVELQIEDAIVLTSNINSIKESLESAKRVENAIRKALEQLK